MFIVQFTHASGTDIESTMHAVDTQMKSVHKQGVGERREPHSLQNDARFLMNYIE